MFGEMGMGQRCFQNWCHDRFVYASQPACLSSLVLCCPVPDEPWRVQKAALLQNMSRAGEKGGGCGFGEKGSVQKHWPLRPSLRRTPNATIKQVVRPPPTEQADLLQCVSQFDEGKKNLVDLFFFSSRTCCWRKRCDLILLNERLALPPPVRDSRRKLKGMLLITDRLPTSRGGHMPRLMPSTPLASAQLIRWCACPPINTSNRCPFAAWSLGDASCSLAPSKQKPACLPSLHENKACGFAQRH